MYCSEVTSKFFYIIQFTKIIEFSVYNSQVILTYLNSRISNELLNIHVWLRYTNNCCYFFCYLFPKLSEIIVEKISITLFKL